MDAFNINILGLVAPKATIYINVTTSQKMKK